MVGLQGLRVVPHVDDAVAAVMLTFLLGLGPALGAAIVACLLRPGHSLGERSRCLARVPFARRQARRLLLALSAALWAVFALLDVTIFSELMLLPGGEFVALGSALLGTVLGTTLAAPRRPRWLSLAASGAVALAIVGGVLFSRQFDASAPFEHPGATDGSLPLVVASLLALGVVVVVGVPFTHGRGVEGTALAAVRLHDARLIRIAGCAGGAVCLVVLLGMPSWLLMPAVAGLLSVGGPVALDRWRTTNGDQSPLVEFRHHVAEHTVYEHRGPRGDALVWEAFANLPGGLRTELTDMADVMRPEALVRWLAAQHLRMHHGNPLRLNESRVVSVQIQAAIVVACALTDERLRAGWRT